MCLASQPCSPDLGPPFACRSRSFGVPKRLRQKCLGWISSTGYQVHVLISPSGFGSSRQEYDPQPQAWTLTSSDKRWRNYSATLVCPSPNFSAPLNSYLLMILTASSVRLARNKHPTSRRRSRLPTDPISRDASWSYASPDPVGGGVYHACKTRVGRRQRPTPGSANGRRRAPRPRRTRRDGDASAGTVRAHPSPPPPRGKTSARLRVYGVLFLVWIL
jgi:hypothetical protein